MPVREGGSYVANEKTGEVRRVEATDQPDGHRLVEVETVPEVPTAPAPPEPAPAEPPANDHPEA